MKERPILYSKITGRPSQRGQRLKSKDGLTWKQRHREGVNARVRELYALNNEKHRKRAGEYRKANREKVNAYNVAWLRRYYAQARAEMFVAYGGRCACCGETEPQFLDMDHIKNDGKSDRALRGNGQQLAVWLRKNGWPRDRYQLLCCNCNQGKARNRGVCPHQERRSHAVA